jgi:hypothetical protein
MVDLPMIVQAVENSQASWQYYYYPEEVKERQLAAQQARWQQQLEETRLSLEFEVEFASWFQEIA